MVERRSFWSWFWGLFGLSLHYFVIDEKRENYHGRADLFRYYKRRFWHFYKVYPDGTERQLWQAHVEIPVRKKIKEHWFGIHFHVGNNGSETPWDGYLTLFGTTIYWGHTGFRKLADRISKCEGYKYDHRDFTIKVSGTDIYYDLWSHSDMCETHSRWVERGKKVKWKKNWRSGSINLSIPKAIWGPKRYSYEDLDTHQAILSFPDGDYAVILTLQKQFYGRTKIDKSKHEVSFAVDVDAPRGIPSHVDHSGGWKGDRTFGYGVEIEIDHIQNGELMWKGKAEVAAKNWVLRERERTGFVKPDPITP